MSQSSATDVLEGSMTFSEAKQAIDACIRVNLVPFLTGSPGVGKSALAQDLADQHNLKLIDFRLSQAEPTDLNGFPFINQQTGIASYAPMSLFPIENTPLPDKIDANGNVIGKYNGWLLFLDEFNSASLAVQKAAYKLTLDKMIGQFKLHSNVRVVCAGNLETDNAIVAKLSTAMQSRLIHFKLRSDQKEWINWAAGAQIDFRVTSFIQFKPDMLNMFQQLNAKKAIENTFPCERTWEFVSKLIKKHPDLNILHHGPLLSGAIGRGVAHEFIAFTAVYTQLPTIAEIEQNPLSAKLPTEPSSQYAITGLLANHADSKNAKQILDYASRLPTEFTVITMQNAVRRNPTFMQNEHVSKWIDDNHSHIV